MDPISTAAAVYSLWKMVSGGNDQQISQTGLSPDLQAQLMEMLRLQTDRARETAPIHRGAMAMASRLAPTYARDAMTSGGGPSGSSTVTPARTPSTAAAGSGAQFNGFNLTPSSSNPFVNQGDNAFTRIGGNAYGIPGGTNGRDPARPMTGPEDPDPMHHPMDEATVREISDALQRWFGGNPMNAFFGNGMSGGEQTWNGGRGRAY